jgi:hypothetical protein
METSTVLSGAGSRGMRQKWAKLFKTVYVISGSLFDENSDRRPDEPAPAHRMNKRVGIPTHFFKIIARDCGDGRIESLTIILPHENKSRNGDAGMKFLQENVRHSLMSTQSAV